MKISELFYSIQGEGKRTGFPSFFIRTNFCNLRCKFPGGNLCDTAYTSWNPEDEKNIGNLVIKKIIDEYKKFYPVDVVITGGEPTIQLEELNMLTSEIKKISKDISVTIETNGTFIGDFVQNVDLVSISPKISSSVPYGTEFEKMHQQNRINIDVFKKYNELHKNKKLDVQWKFVVNDENDINEILSLSKDVGFSNHDIFLMPEGITKTEIEQKRQTIVELCKKYKMNFTDRLHILIWGNVRGV
jgi:7-carboxy-7-deazaguanine synthase